ncbi:MAG TPA: sugar phosphate isomerase/epimerase [Candidatus Hydrogenedentes bacterium]|nr:sugar phosphate isomerase/epimerase [Candidatus Hydrogenedentota bacterium]HRK33018.1 sugar phosphate isomerase/epimerase [Candidatus Hydrogenedentota bacterium]
MSQGSINRRQFIQSGAVVGGALAATTSASAKEPKKKYQNKKSPWPVVLNASTIRKSPAADPTPALEKIRVAAEAGYDGIELWMNDLEELEKGGNKLSDVAKEIKDRGLFVPNVIGLWDGMPATQEEWEKSLTVTRDRMRMVSEVGSLHVAALPFPDRENFDLAWATDRYRDLLRIGRDDYDIKVTMEFIGFLKGLNRLGEACCIAIDSDEPSATVLPDTFHLFRGGSGFNGIRHLQPELISDFHWNDVPATPGQFELRDRDRVMPGDGILPLTQCLKDLYAIGYTGPLSLEIFNEEYWKLEPKETARIGLEKMLANIATAFA